MEEYAPAIEDARHNLGSFPHAEYHSDHSLSLPFWSGMPLADADRVVETLHGLLQRAACA